MRIVNRIVRHFSRKKREYTNKFIACRYDKLPNRKITVLNGRTVPVIVSLTSYPDRFKTLYLVVKSIMYQTIKPDRIVLYLDEQVDIDSIPESLKEMTQFGLEIVNRPQNIKCHKKYYYAMAENSNAIVITIDDDSIYEKHTIEELLRTYEQYPDCVCAKRVHSMKSDKNGYLLPYNDWEMCCSGVENPSYDLIATGVGAVLYPPKCMNESVFDISRIMELSLRADDIWLKIQQLRNGTKVVWAKTHHIEPYQIPNSQSNGLFLKNVDQQENDVYIRKLFHEYKGELRQFFKVYDDNN